MFHKLPYILLLTIIVTLLLSPVIPLSLKQSIYAISLTTQSLILFLLPIIIFSLMFKTMSSLAKQGTTLIIFILLAVCLSNFTATFLSHYVGSWLYHLDLSVALPKDIKELQPAWGWRFPKLIANNYALFSGILFGFLLTSLKPRVAEKINIYLERVVGFLLNSFIYLIPVFIVGFIIKLSYSGVITILFKDYSKIFLLIALTQFSYIVMLYVIANKFNLSATLRSIKNMIPAVIAGFSSLSSAAAMPLTMAGVEQNAKHKFLAKSIIPATVNIHLIGDCFAIPIFAYAVMKSFGMAEPALLTYVIFVFYFVIAKFSVAAIPGGGILVMLPILESYLGFNTEMLSLITALYILFDPVITSANVFGNGAFAKLIDSVWQTKTLHQPTEAVHNTQS